MRLTALFSSRPFTFHSTNSIKKASYRTHSTKSIKMIEIVKVTTFPSEWPYNQQHFKRSDESSDSDFYSDPRFCTHIDDEAIESLTQYYQQNLPNPIESNPPKVVDICSSWISHLPPFYTKSKEGKTQVEVFGIGMNEKELEKNKDLKGFAVKDLNQDPTLPLDVNSQDAVICAVSVDYLNKPRQIFGEIGRILKPGGTAHMSFSNRCFPTKVIGRWLKISEEERTEMISHYFHFAGIKNSPGELFKDIEIVTLNDGRYSDPMWVVRAVRK